MNVQNITGHNSYNPYYDKHLNTIYTNKNKINFKGTGIPDKAKLAVDCVVMPYLTKKERVFRESIKNIMQKIQMQSCSITPEKLEEAIIKTQKAHPDTSEKAILLTMQRLTQWADYSSFEPLANMLTKEKISNVSLDTNNDLLNKSFCYFLENKGIIGAEKYNENSGSFVTNKNIHRYTSQSPNTKIINLEGFEEGINFLSDNELLASRTIKLIGKVKKIMSKKPNIFFEEAISQALNNKILNDAKNKNIEVTTFSRHNFPARKTILEQMSPCSPKSANEITLLINTIVQQFIPNNGNKAIRLRNNLAKYFEDNIEIFTKQRLINSLKNINQKIMEFTKFNDIPKENIFYLIPREKHYSNVKSFGIITEMYKRMHKIDDEKILYHNNLMSLRNLPQKSAIVILDDVSISGDSMKYSAGYESYGAYLRDDIHIIFAPLITYKAGVNVIQRGIQKNNRTDIDKVITSIEIEKKEKFNLRNILLKLYFSKTQIGKKAYGYSGLEELFNEKFVILPYMAPDNNSKLSTLISKLFFPCKDSSRFFAIKNTHFNFSEIYKKMIKPE